MDFRDAPRRVQQENLLPMINVVFLLLIFFLIAARLTQPEPFAVVPPQAQTEAEAEGLFTLYIGADAQMGYRDALGDAALVSLGAALAAHCATADCLTDPPLLTLRADAALPDAQLASLLPRLADLRVTRMELVAEGAAP